MTYVPPIGEQAPGRRLPRVLDATEVRILGSLMEKQLATPEYYPLTLNALVAACNQKTSREPVTDLTEEEVDAALQRLQDEKLVWRVMGGRAVRYDHNLDRVWHLDRKEKALLTLLFLRGPQTAGELRARSDRLQSFESVAEVEQTLREMASHSDPLLAPLPRRPGQKEERWAHLAGGAVAKEEPAAFSGDDTHSREPLSVRVQRLEERLAALEMELADLKKTLGE
ncbi:MAG TPA: YceH family protein [Thermoanaerobaculia bacterium]|nr:YceH family protein [Thermoanaerobaculia bacterium]